MKKGKNGEKPIGPMFPRLHVNDTDKGGPRAPPRNKMALYEQFSIPSQRPQQQQQPTPVIPPPRNPNPNQSTDPAHQASTSRGTGQERSCSGYSEFSMSSTPKPDPKSKKVEDDFAVPVFVHDPRRKHVCQDSRFKVDVMNKENSGVVVLNTEKRVQTSDLNLNESRVYSNMGTNALEELSCMDNGYTSAPQIDLSTREQGHMGEISENTIVDSVTAMDVSPDNVVGVIGQKSFWNARKQLLSQQRLFAVQIFELHRLITVQKVFAGSPQILLQDDKISSDKLTLDLAIQPSASQTTKPKESNVEPLEKIEHSVVGRTDPGPSTSQNHPLPNQPPPNNNIQILRTAPTAPETIPNVTHWPYYQTADHFFLPEMSPSEGFIFKAYPISDFMGPIPHNNNIHPHPLGYFPQFGIPAMNQTIIGQTQPTNHIYPPHISVTSRGSQLVQQVSTASSPDVQASEGQGRNGNTIPFFSTPSTATKVIKVVPHNAKTASESVARIFQSIQEGRK